MNDRAASVFLFGLVIVIGMCAAAFIVYALASHIWHLFDKQRERKALAKRDRNMRRWGMKPFDQDRQQS